MPPAPEADQPRVVAAAATGSASGPHRGGSAPQSGPSPQNATGAALPDRAATSYPLGSSVRTRSIRTGFTEADEAVVAVDGAEKGACPHAATQKDSAASKANSRTPVDTTEIA